MSDSKELSTEVSKDLLAEAAGNMPVDTSYQRVILPRIGMYTQDQTEGKGKSMTVTAEAGTYYIDQESDELNDEGKKVWTKTELGPEIEATVIYHRKKLSYYDNATNEFTASPIFDEDTDVVPLFKARKEIARGTPKDLKKNYMYVDPKDGKTKSKLQDMVVLYVLYKGKIYQSEIKGTSMWAFKSYSRTCVPPVVLTRFNSEYKENGSINWNQMKFITVRKLTEDEVREVVGLQNMIKSSIKAEKDYFASLDTDVPTEEASGINMDEWNPDSLPKVNVEVLGDGNPM